MKLTFKRTLLILLLVTTAIGLAFALPAKPHKTAVQTKCPVCHMTLSNHWTKATPVAVQLKKNGPVMYCCAACKMPKSALYKAPDCPVCHMQLSTHWTKATPVAVRLKKGGPVLYCCKGCKMPASVLVHQTAHKHKK